MSRYALSPAANRDLAQIREYLRTNAGKAVATRVVRDLREAVRRIAAAPGIGHARPDLTSEPVRFLVVHSYYVVYAAEMSPLMISRIVHTARNIERFL